MVSRADLAGWPLIGFAARSVGTVFVDRADAASGASALRSMRTHLAAGSSVIVFPEGTTFPDDEVRPFQPGAFVAAARAGVDVLPVGLAYETGSGAAFFGEAFTAHLARWPPPSPRASPCAWARSSRPAVTRAQPTSAPAPTPRCRASCTRLGASWKGDLTSG